MEMESYIVQVEWRTYFVGLREGNICETAYPSAACHMDYDIGDAACQKIRARGLADSVVCDQRGDPVIAIDLAKAQPISESKIAQFYDDRATETDWAIFRGVAVGEDLYVLASRLGIEHSDLVEQLDDVNRRITDECNRLHKSNDEKRELLKCDQIEHTERMANQFGRKK
jgi:hypothetical protein